ncbi:MAG: thiol-disulfide oxidoreductase DCC family protein [Planctomycetota bacterium]
MTVDEVHPRSRTRPSRDTVLFDGHCRFCRGQIAALRRLDACGLLEFMSLHDPRVADEFPEIPPEQLLEEMVVVDRQGRIWRGASAVRYLSRRLVALWPLAVPLHVPGTLPLWRWLYRLVARNRHRIAGTCDDGGCRIPS